MRLLDAIDTRLNEMEGRARRDLSERVIRTDFWSLPLDDHQSLITALRIALEQVANHLDEPADTPLEEIAKALGVEIPT